MKIQYGGVVNTTFTDARVGTDRYALLEDGKLKDLADLCDRSGCKSGEDLDTPKSKRKPASQVGEKTPGEDPNKGEEDPYVPTEKEKAFFERFKKPKVDSAVAVEKVLDMPPYPDWTEVAAVSVPSEAESGAGADAGDNDADEVEFCGLTCGCADCVAARAADEVIEIDGSDQESESSKAARIAPIPQTGRGKQKIVKAKSSPKTPTRFWGKQKDKHRIYTNRLRTPAKDKTDKHKMDSTVEEKLAEGEEEKPDIGKDKKKKGRWAKVGSSQDAVKFPLEITIRANNGNGRAGEAYILQPPGNGRQYRLVPNCAANVFCSTRDVIASPSLGYHVLL